MYKVVVLAHNLKEIETEPVEVNSRTDESIYAGLGMAFDAVVIMAQRGVLKNRSLTIQISEAEK